MSKNAPRLGKGLSALIAPRETAEFPLAQAQAPAREVLRDIPISRIRRNPRQPRGAFDADGIEQLAESIRSSGILQPVLVRPLPDGGFELVAGERRWRAAELAGLERIPAIVRSVTDAEALELALIENLQREDLNALERARAYRQCVDTFEVSIEELGRRIGESRANISNYMRILKLSTEIQQLIESGKLGMGQARAIAGVDDQQRQLALAKLTVRRNLAVRQVEALAKGRKDSREKPTTEEKSAARHIDDVERALRQSSGLTLKLLPGRKKNSGRIVIYYRDLDEFDRVAGMLGGGKALE